MDEQIVELMRDRFDKLDAELQGIHLRIKEHTDMDVLYWKKIDAHAAQISMIKWLSSGVSGSALLAWLYTKLGGH